MKKAVYLSLFIMTLVVASSFANKLSDEKETRDLSGFTKISFGTSGYLYITFGSEYKVVLEGDGSYLDEIVTEVRGDRLVIRNRHNNWNFRMNQKVTVYITMPELEGLGVSGSGKAEIRDVVKGSDLDLGVSGSGRIITSDLNVSRLDCGISGSGNINLQGGGNIDNADISISGSGGFTGENAKIDMADISISGSGNCSCNVTGSLKAGVSGSGDITYTGNPKIDARVSGSGKVRSR